MNKTVVIILAVAVFIALALSAIGLVIVLRGGLLNYGVFNSGIRPGMGMLWKTQRADMPGRMADTHRGILNRSSDGKLEDYLKKSLAEELKISVDELDDQIKSEGYLLTIPAVQDLTVKELNQIMTSAKSQALEQAIADGVISEQMAERYKDLSSGLFLWGMGWGR